MPKSESQGRPTYNYPARAKQVQSEETIPTASIQEAVDFLFSSSSEEDEADVRAVRVSDKGSITQCVKVQLQGVPVYGLIDSGADISIIGGSLFKKVATTARLKKRNFRKPDKVPRTYDQKPFQLDGCMDLDISFEGKEMHTTIYVKMDAYDQLLLSEGVCRQLGILAYHDKVEQWRGRKKRAPPPDVPVQATKAKVPMVRVNLVQSVHLLPHQSKIVDVQMETKEASGPLLFEPGELTSGVYVDPAVIEVPKGGCSRLIVSNPTGMSCSLEEGCELGGVNAISIIQPPTPTESNMQPTLGVDVKQVQTDPASVEWRKSRLIELIGDTELLEPAQREKLLEFLTDRHAAFCLEEHERGETDEIEFRILTEDVQPCKLPSRRMPFAVREEVARQLKAMQASGVIQPSSSPWASPVVMVRKKDGSHRFCIDYRALNAVTKADTYPLPHIDDLLDQLGECKYFSTLDLASGYWQIRVHADSQEKTAFVTPQGLFEFRVKRF